MLSKYEDKNTRMQPLYPRPRAQCSLILVAHHPLLLCTMRHHHRGAGYNRENSFRIGDDIAGA